MQQNARDSRPSLISRVFRRPSSKLGSVGAAAMAGSIGLLLLFTALVRGGTDQLAVWQEVVFLGILLCLLASYGMGLAAVLRARERSWAVLLPTALISVVVANELVQLVLQLAGHGG